MHRRLRPGPQLQRTTPASLQEMTRLGLPATLQSTALEMHFGREGLRLRDFIEAAHQGGDPSCPPPAVEMPREAEAVVACQRHLQRRRGRADKAQSQFYDWLRRRGFTFEEARLLFRACTGPATPGH